MSTGKALAEVTVSLLGGSFGPRASGCGGIGANARGDPALLRASEKRGLPAGPGELQPFPREGEVRTQPQHGFEFARRIRPALP